ncbi:FMN-binding glutamate synthase family protein, partial [Candidatus Sumerlaeota bacterium]|nr:FMN-binding glutamate synthase family protein [Candidatus Sumerlaeota bacterium]
ESVKMIEIKLSQGAKPAHGGLLPAKKVTQEIADIRGLPKGERVVSPPTHSEFSNPIEMLVFIERLRDLSGGKPVGIKLCIGQPEEFVAIVKAMREADSYPDFIAIDGSEGGTGAAPFEFSNSIGMPLRDGLAFANNVLIGAGVRDKTILIASGKIITGFHMFRVMALGADVCNSARGMMFAIGCIQARRCNHNDCPVGVATTDPRLDKAINVVDKGDRVAAYHEKTIESFLAILAAAVLATMRWHVIFSRLLFRSLLLPLWITLIVWSAAEVRRSPKIWKAIVLGTLVGSGFYTYLAWYFMLPGVAALLVWVFRGIASNRDLKRCAVSCSIALIVTSSPILLHYAAVPDHFLSRPGAVSPFKDGAGAAVRELSKNLLQASGMFHYRGDHVPKHNLPGAPALDRISGIVFLLGLGSCLYRLARRRYGGAERCALETILVSWLLLGMMPTIFAKTDSPNFLRTLVLTPAVAGLIAIGLSVLWDLIDRLIGAAKKIPPGLQDAPRAHASPLTAILIGALILASATTTVRDVFGRWAPSPEVWMSFNGRQTQLGKIAGATPPGAICWIPAAMGSHRTVQYLTAGTDRVRLYSDFDFLRPDPDGSGPMRVVATEHNVLLPVLRRLVPSGRVIDVMIEPRGESLQPWAWLFEIPPGKLPAAEEVDRAEERHRIDIRW